MAFRRETIIIIVSSPRLVRRWLIIFRRVEERGEGNKGGILCHREENRSSTSSERDTGEVSVGKKAVRLVSEINPVFTDLWG